MTNLDKIVRKEIDYLLGFKEVIWDMNIRNLKSLIGVRSNNYDLSREDKNILGKRVLTGVIKERVNSLKKIP